MRPALNPGLLPVWRNRDTVQIGIDPRRAVALTGMRGAAGLLGLLDGSRDREQILTAAGDLGIRPEAADRVIALLAAGGALHDFPVTAFRDLPPGMLARLAPELATAALAHGDGDGGARTLARRQNTCVSVNGMSRTGLGIASILSAAGVGQVVSTGVTRPEAGPAQGGPGTPGTPAAPGPGTQAAPGPRVPAAPGPGIPAGACPAGTGPSPSAPPARSRARGRTHSGGDRGRRPDLVILTDSHPREVPAVLMREGIPHLVTSASEAIGVVGPLVLPGRSACLRCLDLTRSERDPAWPLILAQAASHTSDPPACDAVLATAVAAQAAAQALAFIDRAAPAAAVTNGTLELVLPGWQWRRRTWRPHARCGCGRRSTS